MELATTIGTAKSLVPMAQIIAGLVQQARATPNVVRRVLLYLEIAQASVRALGIERQRILSDVRACDVRNPEQVDALWRRLDRYLHEDVIRPHLSEVIDGLEACRNGIEQEADVAWFRTRDKVAAVESFLEVLDTLTSYLDALQANFYPGGSGVGIQTLLPIYELIADVRRQQQQQQFPDAEVESTSEKLGVLARQALRDESQIEWIATIGRVEALVAELQLAFSVKASLS